MRLFEIYHLLSNYCMHLIVVQGSNHTHSGDGHDKLMGFITDTFPLAAYGLPDVFIGRLLYLKLWTSNSNPKLVGQWYLEYLTKTKGNSSCIC